MAASLPFPPYPSSSEPSDLHPGVRQQLFNPCSEGSLLLELRSDTDYSVQELGSAHPADELPGTFADPGSVGLALVVPGTVLHGDHPDVAVSSDVRAAQVVGVDGSSCTVVQWSGRTIVDPQPKAGRLGDLLFRMLDLPTPHCELSAAWYWAAVWLGEVFDPGSGSDEGRAPAVPAEILSWHPAIDPREVTGLSLSELEQLLLERHRDHTALAGWNAVRFSAQAGWLEIGWCPPSVAEWLDDGAFGRWISLDLPSPVELAEVAHQLLSPECSYLVLALLVDLANRRGGDPSGVNRRQ